MVLHSADPESGNVDGFRVPDLVSGLLFSATPSLLVVSVIGTGTWLVVKHLRDGLVTPNEIVRLLIVAPSIAMVVRLSVERTLGTLQETRDREKQKAIQLEEMPLIKAALPHRVSLTFDASLDPALVVGNSTLLQQVLMNLVTNAADAIGGKGNIQIRVDKQLLSGRISNTEYFWVSSPRPGEDIALSVAEMGHGIEHNVVAQIFDPYFTTKNPDTDFDCRVFRA